MILHAQLKILVALMTTRDAITDRYQRVVDREDRGAVTVEQVIITATLTVVAIAVTAAISAVVAQRIGNIKVD
jgi:hypothetical protein